MRTPILALQRNLTGSIHASQCYQYVSSFLAIIKTIKTKARYRVRNGTRWARMRPVRSAVRSRRATFRAASVSASFRSSCTDLTTHFCTDDPKNMVSEAYDRIKNGKLLTQNTPCKYCESKFQPALRFAFNLSVGTNSPVNA